MPTPSRYIDGDIRPAIRNVAGVHLTVLCAVVLASTFTLKRAISFNPKMTDRETD